MSDVLGLVVEPDDLWLHRFAPDARLPSWLDGCRWWSVTRNAQELSIVAPVSAPGAVGPGED